MASWQCVLILIAFCGWTRCERKCYDIAGCFNVNTFWITPQLPEPTEKVMTFGYFYNRENPNGTKFSIYPTLKEVSNLPFDRKKPTFVVLHGHTDTSKLPWIVKLAGVLLDKSDCQIITPDYAMGANGTLLRTLQNLPLVGRLIRVVLDKLDVDTDNLHFIGHSCGGMAAGFACKDFQSDDGKNRKVKQLTLIDFPNGIVSAWNPKTLVYTNDAHFVDIYHTHNGRAPSGHIDIYFNDGVQQPTCFNDTRGYRSMDSCFHHLSHDYYVISISNSSCYKAHPVHVNKLMSAVPFVVPIIKKFPLLGSAKDCGENCFSLGLDVMKSASKHRGTYQVNTSHTEPYCTP